MGASLSIHKQWDFWGGILFLSDGIPKLGFSTGHPSPTARPLAFAWFMERVAWAKLWPLVPLSITKNPCHLADPQINGMLKIIPFGKLT